MSQDISAALVSKETLKALRAERRDWIAGASALARENKKARKAVMDRLAVASATVPEITEATGLPPDTALWMVASLKKFGEVVESEKDGSFYRYALAAEAAQAQEA
ncbi:MAG: winged helix-turn-helix domain-containing protein [Desulfovibrionaceae bacterium]|nr:winged helix-turn-helix domain-containing protein [Desulfovibrionaceae bacterium]